MNCNKHLVDSSPARVHWQAQRKAPNMLTFPELTLEVPSHNKDLLFPGLDKVWRYLEKRGISEYTAEQCGLLVVKASELIAASRSVGRSENSDTRAAIVFPHYGYATDSPIDWWSARLVDTSDPKPTLVKSFADLTTKKPLGKMFCPPSEPPHAYIPPILDWRDIPRKSKIFIHESCIKSINGALLHEYSLGLNGVWGWLSKKHSIALVDEIKSLPWKALDLQPVILFDSNIHDNWDVQHAASALGARIYTITGQRAQLLRLPKTADGEDQGFDDFVQSVGMEEAKKFLNSDTEEVGISDVDIFKAQLNNEVCIVRSMGKIVEQKTGTIMSLSTFSDVNYAHYTAVVTDENGKMRKMNVPKMWMTDKDRVEVARLEYNPGEALLNNDSLNLWRGMGLDPEPGSVSPWMELLTHNVEDDFLKEWVLRWLAYPLQNPGSKLNSLILLVGPSGTGKDLFLRPFHRIYGQNAIKIGNNEIRSQFTSLWANKQFLHLDELTRSRADADLINNKLKGLCTDENVTVNQKGQPEFKIRNRINIAITSNYLDCVKLDMDDRRSGVLLWKPVAPQFDHRGDEPYWQRYVQWCDNGGAEALYDFLLTYDVGNFNPMAWAPGSEAKELVKESGMSPLEAWVRDLYNTPDEVLPIVSEGKSLWTSKELATLFYGCPEDQLRKSQIDAVGVEMRSIGFQRANDGKVIRTRDGRIDRYWVVRDRNTIWDAPTASASLNTRLPGMSKG